jgi:L,D-peptidoglycan transpeptidase YkuD (ErfK/YbiS/YcfS/YnhG family)
MKRYLTEVRVLVSPLDRRRGTLVAGAVRLPCALGRAGARWKRREGDGASPLGVFGLRRAHYRADRLIRPRTGLPLRAIRPGDWWADDPADRAYNRLVTSRPAPPDSQEWLSRQDRLYDVIVEIGFNDRPVVRNRGSGIFWHVARPGFTPTAGCVATTLDGLLRALPRVGPRTRIRIG